MKENLKIILSFCLFLINIAAIAQNKIAINGKIDGYSNKAIIYLLYKDKVLGKEIIDSVKLIQNQFNKDLYIKEPTELIMVMSPKGKPFNEYSVEEKNKAEAIGFYVDKGEVNLKFDGVFKKFKLDPPIKINEDYKAYRKIIYKDWPASRDSINRYYSEDGTVSAEGTINIKQEKVEEFEDALWGADQKAINSLLTFAKKNTDSYVSLMALSNCFKIRSTLVPQILEILNSYTPELLNTTLGLAFRKELEEYKNQAIPAPISTGIIMGFMKPNVGEPAPSFELKNTKGKSIKLNKYKGKYVLVDFWASWCLPCREENPNLKKAYDTHKDRNFTILSVSLDEKYVDWLGAVTSDGLDWEQVGDLKGFKSDVALQYGIQLIPQNILIDPKGIIIGKNLRGQALEDKLAEIL